MNKLDLVTFGETMVVFNPDQSGPLKYVNNFTKSIGGAESNVAIALARLGHDTGWFSRLGDDTFGKFVKSIIRGEGVDVSRVKCCTENSTGILFKERFAHTNPNVYYYRKNSAASFLCKEDVDEDYIKSAKMLHITGITPALSISAREAVFKAVEIARENNVLVVFDPNIRLKLWNKDEAKEVLCEIAKQSDIVIPGLDEGNIMFDEDTPEDIADTLLEMGCKIVAIKLGKEGCFVADNSERFYSKGYEVSSVEDTVGAGDGFAAGLISGILRELSLHECAEFANAVGAMAVLVRGDMEGYPYYEQLLEFIGKKNSTER